MNMNGIRFKGYKSFNGSFISIGSFPNMTIFVGKNNSGKSSCIDIIESLTNPEILRKNEKNGFKLQISHILTAEDINSIIPMQESEIISKELFSIQKKSIGKEVFFTIESIGIKGNIEFMYELVPNNIILPQRYNRYWQHLIHRVENDWEKYTFRKLGAERNIVPEIESNTESLEMTGAGATNLIRKFINYSSYNEKKIEQELLEALNCIIYPDSKYSRILVQQINQKGELLWEIFLEEHNQRFELSKMGSGLKTIVLVLLNLLIIPETKKYKNQKIIYAFEELENNLHPALQRRLFDYLYKYSCENDIMIFLTTHSHVTINTFCEKELAQILHVSKKNSTSTVHRIDDYFTKSEVLNDLDVRASDLLQANGIIWVEGPSDRIYIKHWINMWSNNKLQEGRDYQFLYYGGRLLSHYTVEVEANELISVLLTNRNAAIVIDSDKRYAQSPLNNTKKRIQSEFQNANLFCWITKGKEIENYIPYQAIEHMLNKKIDEQCDQYECFPKYITDFCPRFTSEKVGFANKVCEFITLENSKNILDLEGQVKKLIDIINEWNPKY